MCASACGTEGGSGTARRGGARAAGGGQRGWARVRAVTRPSPLRSPPPPPPPQVDAGPRSRVFLALPPRASRSPSFISELELEGKCNPRSPTKGGKSNPAASRPAASRPASEHSSLAAGRPLLPAPPASRPGLGAGAAPHVTGVPGGWGVPRAGQREDGRREGGSGRPAGPPLGPARQRLFLIRVAGAVPPGSRVFVNV